MFDLKNDIGVVNALDVQTISTNTTTAGDIIDLQDYEGATFILQSGTVTDGSYAVLVEEGDDSGLSDAAAVADGDLIGTEANAAFVAADDNEVRTLGYRGEKRYIRVSLVSTGTTSGGVFGATCIKSHPHVKPDVTNKDAA